MRSIDVADISRVLLTSVDGTVDFTSWDTMLGDNSPISSGLRLRIDEELKNWLVSRFLGVLSYRSRERILRLIARLTGWTESDREEIDLIDCWRRVADDHLVLRESYYVKPVRFEDWRRQTHALDEDVPMLVHLVESRPELLASSSEISRFLELWPTFIRGDDQQLYRELSRGIACLHLHLTGSYPSPYLWVGLMNRRFSESDLGGGGAELPDFLRGYRRQGEVKSIALAITRARAIRLSLFKLLHEQKLGSAIPNAETDRLLIDREPTVQEIEDVCKLAPGQLDYAADAVAGTVGRSLCPTLCGERWLLLRVMRELAALRAEGDSSRFKYFSRMVWAYLVAKSSFLSIVEQAEGTAGFDYFEHTLRMMRWDNETQRMSCAREIGHFLQESGAVVRVELMIAPQKSEAEYEDVQRVAREIQAAMRSRQSQKTEREHGPTKVGLVVHFIKSYGERLSSRVNSDGSAYRMYHSERRRKNIAELELLVRYMSGQLERVDTIPIVGVDTANRELYCPPEIFSELYESARRTLRFRAGNGRYLPVRCTCHVGEDFNWLTTGLRRIYEASRFMALRAGDRLGHASALGLRPQTWIDQHPTIELALIDLLDDAVFEHYLLRTSGPDPEGTVQARMNELELEIERLSIEIFGEVVSPGVLERAWLSRGNGSRHRTVAEIPKWVELQGEFLRSRPGVGSHSAVADPRGLPMLLGRSESNVEYPRDSAGRILDEYLFDKRTVDRFIQTQPFDTTSQAVHVERLQKLLREHLSEHGIVIESNPTSNWLINSTLRHSHVPAVRWLVAHPEFPTTINPDDPTVFATSIENEYFFVYAAMAWGGPDSLPREEALRRVSIARARALDSTFIE